jgi:hypothetical protein
MKQFISRRYLKKKKDAEKPMTEFQKALNKETSKIDALVASMEDNALDLKNEIEMGIEDLEKLERQKDPRLKFINPGDRQMKILKEIGDQELMTN